MQMCRYETVPVQKMLCCSGTHEYGAFRAAEGRGLQGDRLLCLSDNSDLTLFNIHTVFIY